MAATYNTPVTYYAGGGYDCVWTAYYASFGVDLESYDSMTGLANDRFLNKLSGTHCTYR